MYGEWKGWRGEEMEEKIDFKNVYVLYILFLVLKKKFRTFFGNNFLVARLFL